MAHHTIAAIAAQMKEAFSKGNAVALPAMSGKDFRELLTEISK